MSVTLDTLRPHLTRDFLLAFRALGQQIGYRTLGQAIAYMELSEAPVTRPRVPRVPRVSPNGRKAKHAWYCLKGRTGIPKSKRSCCCGKVCEACLRLPEHRFTHNPTGMMAYSFLVMPDERGRGRRLQVVASAMPQRECCGYPMGVMPDSLDPRRWRYQCAVDPKHQEDAAISIAY